MSDTPLTGFQPPTTPAERRAFFDLIRQLKEQQRQIDDLIERVEALESP